MIQRRTERVDVGAHVECTAAAPVFSQRVVRIAIGLLVFIIYLNMLSAARAWIEQGAVSPLVGLWWVHSAMVLLAVVLLAVQNGMHKRLFR